MQLNTYRSLDYSWGLLFKSVSVKVVVERAMEVLREFLETSTIHGLSHTSTAKVSRDVNLSGVLAHIKYLIAEQVGKGYMAYDSMPEFHGGWFPDKQ